MFSKLIDKIFDMLDKNINLFNDKYQVRKDKFKKWIKNECDLKSPNWLKVLGAGIISFFIFRYFYEMFINSNEKNIPASFGTLAPLIISSPVAFIIWYFRDQNVTQQIENQRKDINLKEFQKIAEWVSGQHLTECEVTEKEILEDKGKKKSTEKTTKYSMPNTDQAIPTFSKSDGAVGLQIAAIYSLLPFFRGKHGDSFCRPALNLLTSAWLSLQQKDLLYLERLDILTTEKEFDLKIKNIQKRANSPIGIALTEVLLSDGGDNLLKFPEVFPNLCLAGINFHLPGLDRKVLDLFYRTKDCQGINLVGANLSKANLRETNLREANLIEANLREANLSKANLRETNLREVNLREANLRDSNLSKANLSKANLEWAILSKANLIETTLSETNLSEANLRWANLSNANLTKADLRAANLIEANLRWANLKWATLKWATLSKANLSEVNLSDADLSEANLRWANLKWANLKWANLKWANLSESNLSESSLSEANFEGANLCEVIGIDLATFSNVSVKGGILTDTGNIEWNDKIKQQGGVVLYKQSNELKVKRIEITQVDMQFIYEIFFDIDLTRTQQENPDWQISIVKN